MGNLPINGNLPIEAKGIPNIGWSNSQYRLQDLPVVGIATVFTLASVVCTYNHITVYVYLCTRGKPHFQARRKKMVWWDRGPRPIQFLVPISYQESNKSPTLCQKIYMFFSPPRFSILPQGLKIWWQILVC